MDLIGREMDLKAFHTVAVSSRDRADKYVRSKNFGRAFSHYLIALKLKPVWKPQLKETLSVVLCEWGSFLEKEGRYDDLFRCYEQAIEVFPDNEYVLNNLGSHLLRYGLIKEAAHYFRKSLDIEPQFLRPLRNLDNLSNLVVQRWHFRMLNDSHRNAAFREALRKRQKQKSSLVLDIGTGTGLLSLFALEAGFTKVVACDSSSYMTEVAYQVIHGNNAHGIQLISKHSSELKIPDELPERAGLVVTEILDCGLLGEHVLETLIDVWDRLLLPPASTSSPEAPSGCVIPQCASIFITAIECDSVQRKNFLLDSENCYIDFENCIVECHEENYDCEHLKGLIPGDATYLTEVKKTICVDFNDPVHMKRLLAGELDEVVTLKCSRRGRLDCFAAWFDLHVDKDIILSTGPDSESSDSWDQAIFPTSKNIYVEEGELIGVRMSFAGGKLQLRCEKPITSCESGKCNKNIFHPSQEVVKILNSDVYRNCFTEVITKTLKVFPRPISILDTFPFPLFGLNYLIKSDSDKNRLVTVARTQGDRELIEFVAKKHNLEKRVLCISEEELNELDGKFEVILVNVVEQTGEMKDKIIEKLDFFKSLLKPTGVLLPEKVVLMGRLIESQWLEQMSRVINDEVTQGYKIADFINIYKVSNHIDFDLASIPKIDRSEPFECGLVNCGKYKRQLSVPVTADGEANAMIYWFRMHFIEECPEVSTLNDSVTRQSALLFERRRISGSAIVNLTYQKGLLRLESIR